MPEHDTDNDELDRSESDFVKNKDESSETKFESAKRSLKSVEEKLHRSTYRKKPVMWFKYNEYLCPPPC